eukprot:10577831-Alexandrium_andersonii.AAC.1
MGLARRAAARLRAEKVSFDVEKAEFAAKQSSWEKKIEEGQAKASCSFQNSAYWKQKYEQAHSTYGKEMSLKQAELSKMFAKEP